MCRFTLIQQVLSIEPVSFNGLCFLGEAQHPYHGMQGLFDLASATFSSLILFFSPSCSLQCNYVGLLSVPHITKTLPAQSLQTCHFHHP